MHLGVDALSLAILYNSLAPELSERAVLAMFFAYDLLAFAFQAPLGLLFDRLGTYRGLTAGGLALLAVATGIAPNQWLAAIVAGVGNAMFHAGAGAIVLRSGGGRAGPTGVFVGPGAMGVYAGAMLGRAGMPHREWMVLAAGAAAILMAVPWRSEWRRPAGHSQAASVSLRGGPGTGPMPHRAWLLSVICLILLAASAGARSFVGGTIRQRWTDSPTDAGLMLVLAAVVGKMLGGFVADLVGWRVLCGVALAAAAMLVPASGLVYISAASMFLIQLTMAATTTGTFLAMPGRPATAFGLMSLALVAADPWTLGYALGVAVPRWAITPLTLVAAMMLIVGLTLIPRACSDPTSLGACKFRTNGGARSNGPAW